MNRRALFGGLFSVLGWPFIDARSTAELNAGTRDGPHRHDPLTIGNAFLFFL